MESSKSQLQRQVSHMKKGFFDQGFLDEQFMQLEELQDEINPNFVEEVVTLFFRDSTRLIINIEQALQKAPLDFIKLDAYMHQLKGSGSSIGAQRVKNECSIFRQHCEDGNAEGCSKTFLQVKKEHAILKKKLEIYFQLVRQGGPMETASRPL